MILGAGASRGVSYAHVGEYPSPLDSDFFDLLQRMTPQLKPNKDDKAISFVLARLKSLPYEYRRSMERTFYTLQLRSYLQDKLTDVRPPFSDERIMAEFARAIQALLRKAHGKQVCAHHGRIFKSLHGTDVIFSFNYDLVAERALRGTAEERGVTFDSWLYGLEPRPVEADVPLLFKLHGSSNWSISGANLKARTMNWSDFDRAPGYRGYEGTGNVFPIFLPFWDKRIEQAPWLQLWKNAFAKLQTVEQVIVWGYSLPPTDIKAQQLFAIALANKKFRLCVIDPSIATRQRWRELFAEAQFWEYSSVRDFLEYAPPWIGLE